MADHASEVAQGQRFEFGRNWQAFLNRLSPEQIAEAEGSLKEMLALDDWRGRSFLDIGSGSGLFSLAARRLGATVCSFDFDPQCVACTRQLRERFFPDDPRWTISAGSVLDRPFIESLGTFDVVYAWGVLHHTGAMWQALDLAAAPVAVGGKLFISIYNHQRIWTRVHTALKRTYVAGPGPLRWLLAAGSMGFYAGRGLIKDLARLKNPLDRYRHYDHLRGMSWWYDQLDWVGGYPFETATPEAIFDFHRQRGFELQRMLTCGGGPGCNQFVFRRKPPDG